MFCLESARFKPRAAVILFDKVNPGKHHDALLIKLVMVDLYRFHMRSCRCISRWLLIFERSSKPSVFMSLDTPIDCLRGGKKNKKKCCKGCQAGRRNSE